VLSVVPRVLTVGRSVTISGRSCPVGNVIDVGFGGLGYTLGTLIQTRSSSDGLWTTSVRVTDDTRLGRQAVQASCVSARTHTVLLLYRPEQIVVVTFRRLAISSETVTRGSIISVKPIGLCPEPPPNYPYDVTISVNRTPGPIGGTGVGASVPIEPSGRWSAEVTIPTELPFGRYFVDAVCQASRLFAAYYEDVRVEVT
jgi:hypothetical protein